MSMFGSQGGAHPGRLAQRLSLHQPVSIAVYDSYDDAQHAVDYLADQHFPVSNLSIVGTDLKSIERITGGLNWSKVILSAVAGGVTWGVLAALFVKLIVPSVSLSLALFGAIAIFVIANLITSSIRYAMTGGRRDFTSATQVIATRYEILGEAPVANQARTLLSGGGRKPNSRPERSTAQDQSFGASRREAPNSGYGREAQEASRPSRAMSGDGRWPAEPHSNPTHRAPESEADLGALPPPAWPSSGVDSTPGATGANSSAQDSDYERPGAPASGADPQAERFDPTDRSQR